MGVESLEEEGEEPVKPEGDYIYFSAPAFVPGQALFEKYI
jgi:hypothetical protein